jgi:hypothetical protein
MRTEIFEPAEHSLDESATFVGFGIVAVMVFADGVWRDDGPDSVFGKPISQASGVISLIGDEPAGGETPLSTDRRRFARSWVFPAVKGGSGLIFCQYDHWILTMRHKEIGKPIL